MFHIWRLILVEHRRKRHIIWLFVIILILIGLIPLINSLSLWQGAIVNNAFQHTVIEIVGLLFLVYFGSQMIANFYEHKTLQLLWSKKKEPLQFIIGAWTGLYTIYAGFILLAGIGSWIYYGDYTIFLSYINLLITGAIALSFVILFSYITNPYIAILSTFIIYSISYSLNYIIFSTPTNFSSHISFKILTFIQYLFPKFDTLSSTISTLWSRGWAVWANILYFIIITIIMIRVFLSRSDN